MTMPSRLKRQLSPILAVLFVLSFSSSLLVGQSTANSASESASATSQENTLRLAKEVQKAILGLPDYNVFDWITFGIRGNTVILHGFAARPNLKSQIANVVKRIHDVGSVENQIEVLPLSSMDDRIRTGVYNRIYTQPSLRKYNANQGTAYRAIGPGPNLAVMAGGITADPPRGFHAIHIIVNNGNVTLYGFVNDAADASIAVMQVKSTPGVFSVQNNLVVTQEEKKKPKK